MIFNKMFMFEMSRKPTAHIILSLEYLELPYGVFKMVILKVLKHQ